MDKINELTDKYLITGTYEDYITASKNCDKNLKDNILFLKKNEKNWLWLIRLIKSYYRESDGYSIKDLEKRKRGDSLSYYAYGNSFVHINESLYYEGLYNYNFLAYNSRHLLILTIQAIEEYCKVPFEGLHKVIDNSKESSDSLREYVEKKLVEELSDITFYGFYLPLYGTGRFERKINVRTFKIHSILISFRNVNFGDQIKCTYTVFDSYTRKIRNMDERWNWKLFPSKRELNDYKIQLKQYWIRNHENEISILNNKIKESKKMLNSYMCEKRELNKKLVTISTEIDKLLK